MKKLLLLTILLFAVLAIRTTVFATQDITCPKSDGWTKIDGSMPVFNTEGDIITQICVKGGQDKVFFTENGDNTCWEVMGIGTTGGYAKKIGEGRTCKDISHASFYTQPQTTPTNLPTETITNIPTTEPTVEITQQVSPTVKPTDTVIHPTATPFHPTPTVYFSPVTPQLPVRGSKGGL